MGAHDIGSSFLNQLHAVWTPNAQIQSQPTLTDFKSYKASHEEASHEEAYIGAVSLQLITLHASYVQLGLL